MSSSSSVSRSSGRPVFLISVGTDVVELLVDPASFTRPAALLDRGSTVFVGLLWLLCRRGRRSWNAILAVEWIGLAVLVGVMTLAGRYGAADSIAHFAAQDPRVDPASLAVSKAADAYFSIMLVLAGGLIVVLRAALVPAPPRATLLLTSILGLPFVAVPFFFAPASAGVPALRTAHFPWVGALTYAIWWAIIAVGATVVSHVVFGLRAEVRRARRLGQYTIEAKIGEGGMGVVYRAHHGMMRRPTAIKLLRPEKAIEANLKRFEREVQLTARLTHPHTITIFDYGRTPEGVFYYAMELLEGASLEKVVAVAGRLAPARVVHVLYEVAGALVEAHETGLVHRDVKPANVILCRQGGLYDFPKVVDFGLVKDLEPSADAALTHADVIAGTPLYIAPEAITSPGSVARSPTSTRWGRSATSRSPGSTSSRAARWSRSARTTSTRSRSRPRGVSTGRCRPTSRRWCWRASRRTPRDGRRAPGNCAVGCPPARRSAAGPRETPRAWWERNAAATAPVLSPPDRRLHPDATPLADPGRAVLISST